MRRNRSLLQSIFLRIHYKTSLAIISVFLGILVFSGFYFFGQNIVNEAGEIQRISKEQSFNVKNPENYGNEQEDITPTTSEEVTQPTTGVGGSSTSPTIAVSISPTQAVATVSAVPAISPTPIIQLDASSFLLGEPNAEKTIIAYYDFECKYCKAFIDETLPALKEEYFDSGKAKMIFKNFPLSSHPNAPIAHNAALCASIEGKFWPFHDVIFEKQDEWAAKTSSQVKEYMKVFYTDSFGISSAFEKCVNDNTYGTYVDKDKTDGKNVGVTGTPTFIIGDTILVGHQSIDAFRQVLNNNSN